MLSFFEGLFIHLEYYILISFDVNEKIKIILHPDNSLISIKLKEAIRQDLLKQRDQLNLAFSNVKSESKIMEIFLRLIYEA